MPSYSQLLIPERSDFIPEAQQIVEYLHSLENSGAAPLNPNIVCSIPTGKTTEFQNPYSNELIVRKDWKPNTIEKLTDLCGLVRGLKEYRIFYKGHGPMPLPAFEFQEPFTGKYDVDLHLNVVPEPVSMSQYYPPESFKPLKWNAQLDAFEQSRKDNPLIKDFGSVCGAECTDAYYNHPETLEQVIVPGAGRARFWITFEYGKMLFPKFNKNMKNIMNPTIIKQTNDAFSLNFLPGFNFDL